MCPKFDSSSSNKGCIKGGGIIASKDLLSDGDDTWIHCSLKCAKEASKDGSKGCCEGSDSRAGYCKFYPNGTTNMVEDDTRAVLCKENDVLKTG